MSIKDKFTLEQRMERMEALHDCRNLMGRLETLHGANEYLACLDLHALKTPGCSVEFDWGVYEGAEAITRFYKNYHGRNEASTHQPRNGELHLHTVTTPVIEIADDLQTVTATAISPGVETGWMSPTGVRADKPEAFWLWVKYQFDFVKEDGEWKIWHYKIFNLFISDYYKSWVDMPSGGNKRPPMAEDKAPTRYAPGASPWTYSVDRPVFNVPAPPVPHATYSDLPVFDPTDGSIADEG